MFSKTVLAIAFLLLVSVSAGPLSSTQPLKLVNIIELEEPCVRQGGLCVYNDDCAPENLVQMPVILCPLQHHLNVVCCYL